MKLTLSQACIKSKGTFECRRTPHNMSNQRMHWAVKAKWAKAWQASILTALSELTTRPQTLARADLTIIMYKVSLYDPDGAVNSCKDLIDGLRYANIITNDTVKHINLNVVQIKVGHKNEEKVEINIEVWKTKDKNNHHGA